MFKNINFKFLTVLLMLSSVYSQNTQPIFLIHGFMGWGRDEMGDHRYWGGKNDYEKMLNEHGFNVHTLSVGPISSNWDRAIEAYTQIKGGCVDYGNNHSDKFGIIQRPPNKCYEGLYPQWDENNPIHLIGHSQGGLTARMLEYLLTNSFEDESSMLLNTSHVGWIKSITTVSTPHNGTTLARIIMDIFPFAQSMSAWVAPLTNRLLKNIYRFDLEQWGIAPDNNKESKDFWKEMGRSNIRDSKNFCAWDLSLDGAKEFNSKYRTDKQVYYFSFSTYSSVQIKDSNHHKSTSKNALLFRPGAKLMGKSDPNNPKWNKNDSMVNTVSMSAPLTGEHGPEPYKEYDGFPLQGVWQKVAEINESHHSIIGLHVSKKKSKEIFNIYKDHCDLLYTL